MGHVGALISKAVTDTVGCTFFYFIEHSLNPGVPWTLRHHFNGIWIGVAVPKLAQMCSDLSQTTCHLVWHGWRFVNNYLASIIHRYSRLPPKKCGTLPMNVPILSNFHKHFESQTLFFWFKTSKTPPWLTDGPRQNYGRFLRSSTKHHVHGDVTLAAAEKKSSD